MSKSLKSENGERLKENLAKAFLSLENINECYALFDDLLTVKEIEDLSSRLEVAKLLKSGENYIDIAAATGASTATISRVSKCLTGPRGGYRMVLSRENETPDEKDQGSIRVDSLTSEEAEAVRAIVTCFRAKKQ
jgi:TrpR-related protein YerC/YecD